MPGKKPKVQEADGLVVDTGAVQLAFDAKGHGGLRWVKVGDRYLVRDNALPPLSASLLESPTYEGWRDHVADARRLAATYRLRSFDHRSEGDAFEAIAKAELKWPDDHSIQAELQAVADAAAMAGASQLAHGPATPRRLHDVGP